MVFLLTFMANLSKGAFALQDAEASLASGAIGVSLVILVSFVLVLVSSLLKSFDFGVAYYPLVLMLVLAVVVVFSSDAGNMAAAAVIVLVYSVHVVLADVFGAQRLLELDPGVRIRALGVRARFVGRARRGAGLPACRDGWL